MDFKNNCGPRKGRTCSICNKYNRYSGGVHTSALPGALSRYLSLINRCPMSSCKYHCLGLWLIWSDTEPSFREDVGLCPGSGVSCPILSCRKFSIRSHLRGLGDSCPNLGLGRPLRQRATRAELQPKTGA
ncbi:hypothetical protein J6590_100263 [Homalodisca vitripennis]|nr:hypothetical protein J6590_100263 [Homalodisca vitripennis]